MRADLSLFNAATGFADQLGGSFDFLGVLDGFVFEGFDRLTALGAGMGQDLSIVFNNSLASGFFIASTLTSWPTEQFVRLLRRS